MFRWILIILFLWIWDKNIDIFDKNKNKSWKMNTSTFNEDTIRINVVFFYNFKNIINKYFQYINDCNYIYKYIILL